MTEAAIADPWLIGDLQTSALVSTDGSVDWFCCPRFDDTVAFCDSWLGEQIGTFTHLALIDVAITPDAALDRRR
ncbi:hypothetical protein ACVGVM_12160 [Pseudonocardia bannensis]|uniref:Glycoside hydrolase family 15 protein n=1 Tax=Pseudonocardia bannensis TaxID=630973 RepID=A0A848DF95_9PSEU|nr:hypothetical protein [Pseudonocardia bannensis]NMH91221.1 hypothetical protein [Pseudonocardia bannensis]